MKVDLSSEWRSMIRDRNNVLRPLPIYRSATWCRVSAFSETTFDIEAYLYQISYTGNVASQWLDNITPGALTFAISVLADGDLTGTNSLSHKSLNISDAWPNPVGGGTSNIVHFILPTDYPKTEVRICDVIGRRIGDVRTMEGGEHSIRIPTEGLHNGMYFVRFQNISGSTIKSFMVMR